MNILNKFLMLFIIESEEGSDVETKTNILLSNILNFFFFLIVFSEGVFSLIKEQIFFAAPLLLFSILFSFNYLYFGRKTSNSNYKDILTLFITITFIFFITFGGPTNFNIIWIFLYPLISIHLFGKSKGSTFSFALFGYLILNFLVLDQLVPQAQKYILSEKILISGAYLTFIVFSYALNNVFSEIILSKERIMLNSQNINRSQEELISRLSHQIRTPLSNITGIIAILEQTSLTNDQKDYINTIHASANNLVNVVNSLVAVSKPKLSQVPEEEISFNLYSTLNNTLKLFSNEDDKKHFSLSLSADIPSNVIGNSIRIKQIFLNLLNGIIKHNTSENKSIKIAVSKTDSMPGKLELIFSFTCNLEMPFVQDEKTQKESLYNQDIIHINTAKYVNLLDINITQKLIESDGHTFSIIPDGEQTIFEFGTSFKESFKSQNILDINEKEKPSENYVKPKVDVKDANILLVEDNFSNQQIIILYIKNEVKKIDVAFNGKEALDKFGKSKYDLILMDVQMPIMDGFKATQKIREIEKSTNSHTPIIAVTANAFPEDKERCLTSGMDDYISKPFQPDDLIGKIKEYLS